MNCQKSNGIGVVLTAFKERYAAIIELYTQIPIKKKKRSK